MVHFTYAEIEEKLKELDEVPETEEDDKIGDFVHYLFCEGRPEVLDDFLKDKGFMYNQEKNTLDVNPENLKEIKGALEEISSAYKQLRKGKPETYYLAYPIFGQWGLLHYSGVRKHPFFSDDGIDYASNYILTVIKGVEKLLKKNKAA